MNDEVIERESGVSDVGNFSGAPGRYARDIGVLNLLGVGREALEAIESITDVGAVLIGEGQEDALRGAKMSDVGAVVTVDRDTQAVVEPWTEIDKEMLEVMSPGQKLAIIGMAMFRPDVDHTVVAEKIASLTVVGVLFATSRVRGVLMGRMKNTGSTVVIPDSLPNVVRWTGDTVVTASFLARLPDSNLAVNIGHARFENDIDEALFERKISSYCNVGKTDAPRSLIESIKIRAAANLGEIRAVD